MAVKSYGTLSLQGDLWVMENVPPNVSIRLKQLFPRIAKWATPPYHFANTKDQCADLSWFMMRYPMAMSLDDQLTLEGGRQQFETHQAEMEAILKPEYRPTERVGLQPGERIRHYQGQAIDLTLSRGALLVGDDVGLGKTYTGAGLLLSDCTLPAAVVMEPHLQDQWAEKLEAFTTLRVHKIKGTKPYSLPEADVYLFKYSQLLGWVDIFEGGYFKTVVYDEIQQLRTGRASAKGQAADVLSRNATYLMGLSATPIYNYGAEIWEIMRFLDPSVLGSRDEFMREWCSDGKTVDDPDALGAFLREQNAFIRRTKTDVGQQIPAVNTIVEKIPFDSQAMKDVEDIARQLAITATTGAFTERGQAARQLDLKMRHATGVGKAKGVALYVRMLLEADIPVILAGWHREVYDIWLEELADFKPAMYTGSESPAQKAEAKRRFMEEETGLFIISLRSGAGLDDLQHRCSTAICGELDWSPKIHEQFIGRLYRDGQKESVTAIYLNTDEGSDPPMVELLGLKDSQSTGITDPGKQLEARHSDKSPIQALAEQVLKSGKGRRKAA